MLKQTLLSALLTVSTIATAHINLELNLTENNQDTERQFVKTITIEENVATTVTFDDLDALALALIAQTDEANITIQTQFLQATETDELVPATEILPVQVPFGEQATVTVNDADNNYSLVLAITPTLVE